MSLIYKRDLAGVDWFAFKQTMLDDDFDNLRTPEQYERSFANSYSTMLVYDEAKLIGTARVLSDGVCNAYVVDVWTHSAYRRHGIATRMMRELLDDLQGQHVYLFTDDMPDFYRALGFVERPVGMELVVGRWLNLEKSKVKNQKSE